MLDPSMDSEDIQRKLTQLGRASFRAVVALTLKRVLKFDAANVDGKGDASSDWWVINDKGSRFRVGIQDTIQEAKWDAKALEDAKKAKEKLGINKYYFFTNRHHEQATVTALESRISRDTDLACTVFEARRLAELIIQHGLVAEFVEATGGHAVTRPPEMPEICLCAYSNLSADRRDHRDDVYRDTLLVCAYDAKAPISAERLIQLAQELLSSGAEQRPLLQKQLDHLRTKGRIRSASTAGLLELSAAESQRIANLERLYLSDWDNLASAQMQILKGAGGKKAWTQDSARQAAVFITRMFLQQQLELLIRARVEGAVGQWIQRIGNPEQQLRDLIQSHEVPPSKISSIISEIARLAQNSSIISKLNRTVTFVALEGKDPMLSAGALGKRTWERVDILLDSSVAIPFLCEELHEGLSDYVFQLSGSAVRLLQELGASCSILPGYIEECAAHLVHAHRYEFVESAPEFIPALRSSENAFVAYYGALKFENRIGDDSLKTFLADFSKTAATAHQRYPDIREAARAVMPDIQALLAVYKVRLATPRTVNVSRFATLQKAFDMAVLTGGRERTPILREHDIAALQHLASSTENLAESMMMITWDKHFIGVSRDALPSAFVVSPEMALDFAQPCKGLSDSKWSALAHRLASVTSPAEELTAKILDRVSRMNPEKLRDAQFRRSIFEFRDEALKTLPTDQGEAFHKWVEKSTTAFLRTQKLEKPEPTTS
jgi:hypothetical protein